MSARHLRLSVLAIAGLSAAAVLRTTVRAVASKASNPFDAAMRKRFLSFRSPRRDAVSQVITAMTAPGLLVIATCTLAFSLRRRGPKVWSPIAASPFVAMTTGAIFTRTFSEQTGPGSDEPGFPSGHTTGFTAEATTAAYICRREGLIGSRTAAALVSAVFVGGMNRLYRDRHWATDIIAGWSSGFVIASLCAALYEML